MIFKNKPRAPETLSPPARRNVRLLQAHAVFLNLLFVLPVVVPYYRDVIGLGFYEFMIGEALFSATVILMEIPTGWLSDVWARKKTMIVASATQIAAFAILLYADSFWMAMTVQIVFGITVSLLSGANSALLYDTLLVEGAEETYRKREGLRHGLGLYAAGAAALCGGFLYQWDPRLPVLFSIAASIPAFGLCFLLSEPSRHKQAIHKNPVIDMAVTLRYAFHGHRDILAIMLLSAALFASTKILLWAQQPYYDLLGLPIGWYGIFMALGFLLGGIGGHYGHVFDGRHGNIAMLLFLLAWVCFSCLAAGLYPGYHGILLLLTGSLIWGFGWPRVQDAINKRTGSARRATILSAASLSIHIVSIPLLALAGKAEDIAGIAQALLFMAGFLAVSGTAAFLTGRRRKGA